MRQSKLHARSATDDHRLGLLIIHRTTKLPRPNIATNSYLNARSASSIALLWQDLSEVQNLISNMVNPY